MGDNTEDETMSELAPAASQRVTWTEELATPKPFLIPDEANEGEIVEALPPEKDNRKIVWADSVELCEMPNRKMLGLTDESDVDDDDYEIEIVEDDGDADFYLEIVDGEIFYVFETEGDSDSDDDMESDSDSDSGPAKPPIQFSIESMMAPPLGFDDDDAEASGAETGIDTNKAISSGVALVSDEEGSLPELPTEIQLSESQVEDGNQDDDMELDLNDLVAIAGRPNLLTTESTQDEISLHSDRLSDRLQDSFHESFHASGGSLLIGSPLCSPAESPETQPKESVLASPSTPKSKASSISKSVTLSPGKSPGGSILKACPPSPRRKKQPKDKKKSKGVTKTYVRADTFDGEHQVYTWEKPEWAGENTNKLKETGKGDDIRKGGNLASPITFPKQKKALTVDDKPDTYEDEQGNTIDKEELIRRIEQGDTNVMAFVPLPTYGGKNQRKLKFSVQGQKMRSGQNLAKPITKATDGRGGVADVNHLARPEDHLKKHVSPMKKQYSWKQPEWAKALKLKSTENGSAIKTGAKVEKPVTNIREVVKEYKWEEPEWAKKRLSSTSAGNALKSGRDISRPISKRDPERGVSKAHSSEDLSPRPPPSSRSVTRSHSLEEMPPPVTETEDGNQ